MKLLFTLIYKLAFAAAFLIAGIAILVFVVITVGAVDFQSWWSDVQEYISPAARWCCSLFTGAYYIKWEFVNGPQ